MLQENEMKSLMICYAMVCYAILYERANTCPYTEEFQKIRSKTLKTKNLSTNVQYKYLFFEKSKYMYEIKS